MSWAQKVRRLMGRGIWGGVFDTWWVRGRWQVGAGLGDGVLERGGGDSGGKGVCGGGAWQVGG